LKDLENFFDEKRWDVSFWVANLFEEDILFPDKISKLCRIRIFFNFNQSCDKVLKLYGFLFPKISRK